VYSIEINRKCLKNFTKNAKRILKRDKKYRKDFKEEKEEKRKF